MELSLDIAGQLVPNLATIIVQLLATGVLLFFIKKWLWLPARDYLEKRATYAQEQIASAEALKHEAMTINADANATLRLAGSQARVLVDKAKNDSALLKDAILKEAKREVDQKIEAAQREIKFQQRAMQEEVTKEIVDVALAATERLLIDKTTDEEDRKAIERFVKEVHAK